MPTSRKLGIGYAALAAVDAILAGRSHRSADSPEVARAAGRARRLRFLTKPLLMPTLAAATRSATINRDDTLRDATLAAQGFAWGGDVALLGKSERAFLTGVGSFFAAHVAYIAGFGAARGPGKLPNTTGAKAAAVAWTALAPTMAVLAGRRDPGMRIPIAGYATVLCAMFATSTLLDRTLPTRARRNVTAGTALFLLSDGILGLQEFALGRRSPRLETAVMASYTTGQWLIADGVARAR